MEKKFNKIISICVSILVLSLSLTFLVTPKKDFSENENRVLADFPVFTFENLVSGKYIEDLEDYFNDQFPMRDMFMTIKAKTDILLGKDLINGVYLADNDYLIEEYKTPIKTNALIQVLNNFEKNNPGVKHQLMLVPTSISINADLLPEHVDSTLQLETMNKVYEATNYNDILVYNTLLENNKDTQLFYRLDHHWTTYGAYYAYVEYCNANSLNALSLDDFNIEEVSNEFKGTIFSKLNISDLKEDTIHIFTPKKGQDLTVEYINGDKVVTEDSLYELSYLDTKDKYSLFLNNNNPIIKITNNNIHDGSKLLILKDSYANCFVPFLTEHYEEIHVIDARYYRGSMSEYLNANNIQNTLFLYNMNTIDTDTGIYIVK